MGEGCWNSDKTLIQSFSFMYMYNQLPLTLIFNALIASDKEKFFPVNIYLGTF